MQQGYGHEFWLTVWMGVVVALFLWQRRQAYRGAGLLLAYVIGFWLIHWVGAATYALPWQHSGESPRTALGFALSAQGMIALAAGAVLGGWLLRRRPAPVARAAPVLPLARVAWVCIGFGVFFFLIHESGLLKLPTVGAIVTGAQGFALAGACLLAWQALSNRDLSLLIKIGGAVVGVTLIILLNRGFLGYGVAFVVAIGSFILMFYRPMRHIVAVSAVVIYLGLSLYVTYTEGRAEFRAVVWGGQGWSARLDAFQRMFAQAQWFDAADTHHLNLIQLRLNQNHLVGAAMEYTPAMRPYAAGETLWLSVVALVPRALWPEKPVQGGSMSYVSNYTGLTFGAGTSVGMGQVLEFYINYGRAGVLIGFFALGMLLVWFDLSAVAALQAGRWRDFTLWYSLGLCTLDPGGALSEVTAALAGVGVASLGLRVLFERSAWARGEKRAFAR